MSGPGPVRPFVAGERALLIDAKQRRYLIPLETGGSFHCHAGVLAHDDLIGADEGTVAATTRGAKMLAVRPTLSDYILKMPRGAQVIYPKDIGPMLMLADMAPGLRVLESGVGSGALSCALLRAVGREGSVVGYELRDDFANRAVRNVEGFLGHAQPYDVQVRDCYAGIDERDLDRIMLDLPEPWQVIEHAEKALRPGGILVAYVPTVGQVAQLRDALSRSRFGMADTIEILQRGWHVEATSVRPDHRMVAHTGFLTVARLLLDDEPGRRAPGVEFRHRRASEPADSVEPGDSFDEAEDAEGLEGLERFGEPDDLVGSDDQG